MAFIREEEGVCVEWAEGLLIMQIRDGIHVSTSSLYIL